MWVCKSTRESQLILHVLVVSLPELLSTFWETILVVNSQFTQVSKWPVPMASGLGREGPYHRLRFTCDVQLLWRKGYENTRQ